MRLIATVPATSANLGPGFDCFGLALDLCNEVTLDTDGEPGITWEGEGAAELPTDGTDLVSRAVAETAARFERTPPAAAIHAMTTALTLMRQVVETGQPADRPDLLVGINEIMSLMDYDGARALEERLLTTEALGRKYGAGPSGSTST